MAPRPSERHEHQPMRVPEARMAPEPKTAEQRIADEDERRVRRRDAAAVMLILLGPVVSHGIGHISEHGAWAALALMVIGVGLSVSRQGVSALASPVRGVFLVWLAISVASVVLVSLDSFSGENVLLLAIVWGILLVLWLGDRRLARLLRGR